MTDLYNIPGDNHKDFRLNKFVEYQHEVPAVCDEFTKVWVDMKKLSFDDSVLFCWYLSVTYNEITSVLLYQILNVEKRYKDINQFWLKYKESLNFGSARKYAKNMDWFVTLIEEFEKETNGDYYSWIKNLESENPFQTYQNIYNKTKELKYVGRFALELFLESLIMIKDYLNLNIDEPFELDWKNCSNLTSGIFNIFYEDEKANLYDKFKTISDEDNKYLTEKLEVIQKTIKKKYPNQDSHVSKFVGKICSFRNLFKQARYAGFHHDRQLGVIKDYEKIFPQYSKLWNECYEVRKQIVDERFLGELHGWYGVRPERKKYWIKHGLTCAEKIIYIDDCKLF